MSTVFLLSAVFFGASRKNQCNPVKMRRYPPISPAIHFSPNAPGASRPNAQITAEDRFAS
jgi:hypothetical protein